MYIIKHSGLLEVKSTCKISRYFHVKKNNNNNNSEKCFLVQLEAA